LPKQKRTLHAEVTDIEASADKMLQDFLEKRNLGIFLMLVWVFCLIQALSLVVIGFFWVGSLIQDIPFKGYNISLPLVFTVLGIPLYFKLKRVDNELKQLRSQVTSLMSKSLEQ
jgi:hypothetical protein